MQHGQKQGIAWAIKIDAAYLLWPTASQHNTAESLINATYYVTDMDATIEHLRKDIISLKRDVALIKHILEENYELSEEALEALSKARETSESDYIDLDEL